jgi:hypothetical protein
MRFAQMLFAVLLTAAAVFPADTALLNLIMPEARVLGGIDVEHARDSAIGRKLMDQLKDTDPDFAKFIAATGFDPRRDLKEVVFAATDTKAKQAPAVVLVRGVFDTSKITGVAKSAGDMGFETVNGVDVFTKLNTKDDGAFALIDSSLAIAGTKAAVRNALLRRGGKTAPISAETYAKVQALSRDNDVWFLSNVPVSELTSAMPKTSESDKDAADQMLKGDAFKGIEQVSLGIRFASQMMDITAEALSATAKDATAIADVVRFLATMVQMNREKGDTKALAEALDTMKLTTENKTTRLMISLPLGDLEKMLEQQQRIPAPRKI